jgi:hypothetical protein
LTLRKQHNLTPATVRSIVVKLPPDAVGIVGDSAMVDVNCAHIIAIALLKGTVSFGHSRSSATHDAVSVSAGAARSATSTLIASSVF